MLVINSVKLALFDHIDSISKFKNRHAGRLEKPREPGDKIIDVVNVGYHVIRDHDVRQLAIAGQMFGASRPEEIVPRGYADGICPRYGPVGRINAEAANPPLDEVAQQVSIIAGNLDNE